MSCAVLTSYFTKKKHPNSPNDSHVVGRGEDGFVHNNEFSYIEDWYNSVSELGINGYIFHDGLTEEFCSSHESEKIKFIKVEDSDWSNLDYRWVCYRDFLKNNKFESVFLTDCSDVKVVKNPELVISEFPEVDLFVCKDTLRLSQFPYMSFHREFGLDDAMWFMLNQNNIDLINMGVIGGSSDNINLFLDSYVSFRSEIGRKEFAEADMFVGQYVFRRILKDKKLLIGEPFCSEFKQYQNDREDVYFIHK